MRTTAAVQHSRGRRENAFRMGQQEDMEGLCIT